MVRRPTMPPAKTGTTRPVRPSRQTAGRAGSRASTRAADEGQRVVSGAADEVQGVASTAQARGQQVVDVATDEARRVGVTAREQAERVRGEVVGQTRELAEEARSKLEDQAHAQSRRMADALSRLGDEVRALAEGRPDDAATVLPYLSDAANAVYDAADRLYGMAQDVEDQGLTGVLDDVAVFARRRPGAFLLGTAAAGLVVGRAVRASKGGGGNQPAPTAGER